MESEKEIPGKKPRVALIAIYDTVALGARTLHAILKEAGHDCDLVLFREKIGSYGFQYKPELDREWPSEAEYELLGKLLKERRPRIVGVSFRSFAHPIAKRIAEVARETVDPFIVLGGTHPTLHVEECIDYADAVCVGEGEQAMLELAEAVFADGSISNIENLWVRENGQIHKNGPRPLIQDLDALPLPVLGNENKFTIEKNEIFAKDVYLGTDKPIMYSIAGSRGCPFQCDYCSNSAFRKIYKGLGKYVRKRDPEKVIRELERAMEVLDVKDVAFLDEIFGLDSEWGRTFCAMYKQRVGLPFVVDVHPSATDDQLARAMGEAGQTTAHMGVQSGSERSRRENYHRMTDNREVVRAGKALNDNKVLAYYDFIFNNPYETQNDLEQTLDLILSLPRPHNLKLLSLSFLPKTRITERALSDGLIDAERIEADLQLSITNPWLNIYNAKDNDNAFYGTLAWMDLLKYHYKWMTLIFFADVFGDSTHVVPRRFIRWLSKSNFLRRHPGPFFRAFVVMVLVFNWIMVKVRAVRTASRLLIKGQFKELGTRVRARLAGRQ